VKYEQQSSMKLKTLEAQIKGYLCRKEWIGQKSLTFREA